MTRAMIKLSIFAAALLCGALFAAEGEHPRSIDYPGYAPAPEKQNQSEADRKSAGCISCHTASDAATMHVSRSVVLGCTDCHGGEPDVQRPAGAPRI